MQELYLGIFPTPGREQWAACVARGGLLLEREIDAIPLQICTHPPGTPGYRDQIDIGQILDAGWNLAPPCHRCLGDLEQRERVRGQ